MPWGLYDLDRNIRAVGKAYKQLMSDWRDILPTQSVCLTVPIQYPDTWEAEIIRTSGSKSEIDDRSAQSLFKAGKAKPDDFTR